PAPNRRAPNAYTANRYSRILRIIYGYLHVMGCLELVGNTGSLSHSPKVSLILFVPLPFLSLPLLLSFDRLSKTFLTLLDLRLTGLLKLIAAKGVRNTKLGVPRVEPQ